MRQSLGLRQCLVALPLRLVRIAQQPQDIGRIGAAPDPIVPGTPGGPWISVLLRIVARERLL
jgi:hypothetical protein